MFNLERFWSIKGSNFAPKEVIPVKQPIFLDNQSTTPLDPEVFEVMKPYFLEHFGNASSRTHCYGWEAREAVELARAKVARSIGAQTNEIVFTSGATESIHLAVIGLSQRNLLKNKGRGHIITSNAEHKASLEACAAAEKLGIQVTYLPVNKFGAVTVEQVAQAITPETFLVNLMFANNEIGTLNPIEEIAKICAPYDIVLHTDASQALGKVCIDVKKMGIGLMSLSSHKIYGPKGMGALYISKADPRVRIEAINSGGGQEGGVRGGTHNVPGIVGFGVACEIAAYKRIFEATHITELKHFFIRVLESCLGETVQVNGEIHDRIANNLSLTFKGALSRAVIAQIHTRVAVSTGSSCSSDSGETSHVLKAIGLSDDDARCTIRVGFGRFNVISQIEVAAQLLADAVKKARAQDLIMTPPTPPLNEALSG
jgi:cysteine desulfurase